MKRCRLCKQPFATTRSLAVVCSAKCAIAYATTERAARDKARAERQERREHRERTETPSSAARKAQRWFNAWVRERDAGKPCISCGHPDDGSRQRHASHYKPSGSNPALRFDPGNVHSACSICNNWKSGNLTGYRLGLIERYGLLAVEYLEGPHELPSRRVEDYRAIEAHYRGLLQGNRRAA